MPDISQVAGISQPFSVSFGSRMSPPLTSATLPLCLYWPLHRITFSAHRNKSAAAAEQFLIISTVNGESFSLA